MPDEKRCTHCGAQASAIYEVRHGGEAQATQYPLCDSQFEFVGDVLDDLTVLYREGPGVMAA
jgi:hypothetical protein